MRRVALIVLTVASTMMLATGSLGYTTATIDRGVTITVASDENAYLGLTEQTTECRVLPEEAATPAKNNVESCDTAPVLNVTNQFASEMTVTDLSVHGPDDDPVPVANGSLAEGTTLSTGEMETLHINATAVCNPSSGSTTTTELAVTLSVETDDGTEATRFDKQVTLECSRSNDSAEASN